MACSFRDYSKIVKCRRAATKKAHKLGLAGFVLEHEEAPSKLWEAREKGLYTHGVAVNHVMLLQANGFPNAYKEKEE